MTLVAPNTQEITVFARSERGTQSRFDIKNLAYSAAFVCVPRALLQRTRTNAQALLQGDRSIAARLAERPLRPLIDNFVKRPWGGSAIRGFKGLDAHTDTDDVPIGEAFEIATFDADAEACAHPSRLRLDDGSEISLPQLLAIHGADILGADFVRRFGACFPLLPKTLDIGELLSVQGHPPGNTEVYVIIAADPGATIRLGFSENIAARDLQAELDAGLAEQRRLLQLLGEDVDQAALQRHMRPWLAERDVPPQALVQRLDQLRSASTGRDVERVLASLKRCYWRMLDGMNEISVHAGQVIHNATPRRLLAAGSVPASAEVHALGNPERREILALEIRKPGPTFRAWDNVRFPLREVDVEAAIGALNLRKTEPLEFTVTPAPVPGRSGVLRSVDSEQYRIEHLEPGADSGVTVPHEPPHTLHVLAGAVRIYNARDEELIAMRRGESALVPCAVGEYRVTGDGAVAHVVKASLPEAG